MAPKRSACGDGTQHAKRKAFSIVIWDDPFYINPDTSHLHIHPLEALVNCKRATAYQNVLMLDLLC